MTIRAVLFDIGGTLLFIDPHCLLWRRGGGCRWRRARRWNCRAPVCGELLPAPRGENDPSTEAHDSFRRLMKGIYALGADGAEADEAVSRLDRMNRHLSVWRHPNPEVTGPSPTSRRRGCAWRFSPTPTAPRNSSSRRASAIISSSSLIRLAKG